jgi:hypothetical protein
VRCEERHGFKGAETSIGETGQNGSDTIGGLWDGEIRSWGLGCGATEHELESRSSRTVGCADSGSQVDAK